MYKLIALFAVMAVCMCAPAPSGLIAYSSPVVSPVQVVSPVVSPVVSHVVSPQVTSYSSQSSAVVHRAPVYTVQSAPLVHTVPLTYSSGLIQPVYV